MRRLDPNHAHAELKPADVNVKHLAILGSCLWLVGLAYLGIRVLFDQPVDPTHFWICVTGLVLGALSFWWVHRFHMIDDDGMAALPETIEAPTGETE